MTLKNAFGSMPFALDQSVPVFLRDAIAARTACTIATLDTSEKTKQGVSKPQAVPDELTY